MIELTPLDVRKKKGDFTRGLRGYDTREVDQFLGLVAARLEEVVKVNLSLRERVEDLVARVEGQEGRERAVQDALVTAQSLKLDIQEQAKRDAERIRKETAADADRVRQESEREAERVRRNAEQTARDLEERAERTLETATATIERMVADREEELTEFARRRSRFLESFRMLLERELEVVRLAEESVPDDGIDLDLVQFGQGAATSEAAPEPAPVDGAIAVTEDAGRVEASAGEDVDAAIAPPDAAHPEEGPVDQTDTGDVAESDAATPTGSGASDDTASEGGESSEKSEPLQETTSEEGEASEGTGRGSNGAAGRSRREKVASRESGDGSVREERWGAR